MILRYQLRNGNVRCTHVESVLFNSDMMHLKPVSPTTSEWIKLDAVGTKHTKGNVWPTDVESAIVYTDSGERIQTKIWKWDPPL